MKTRTGTYDMIEGSMHLHGEIADSMDTLRNHVDSGEYGAMKRLLDDQLGLAERAGLMADEIASGASSDGSADHMVIDDLVRQIERALSATNAIAEHIAAEKDRAALQLRTLQNGKRAVQSYARLSGR